MRTSASILARPERRPPRGPALLVAAAVMLFSSPSSAADPSPEEAARAAYERGTAAFQRKDFASAAREYARADELSPSPVALASALKAVLHANEPALGMELCDRAAKIRDAGDELKELIKLTRERSAPHAGQVSVTCPAACDAKIDGKPALIGRALWLSAGAHNIELTAAGRTERRAIFVTPGAKIEAHPLLPGEEGALAEPAAPPPEVAPPATSQVAATTSPPRPGAAASEPGGLSPAWFFAATGLTLTVAGVTVASGVDAVAKHDAFLERPTQTTESTGRAAETRTNVLIGVTAGVALLTATMGVFFVRWSSRASANVALTAGAVRLHAVVSF